MTPLERFMAKVDKNGPGGCWTWTGAHIPNGYGSFGAGYGKAQMGAHRWAYQHFHGPIPEGLYVLHACDVKDCVNPAHLRVGTLRENLREAAERGLTPSGDNHYMRRNPPKLSAAKANDIRSRYHEGQSITRIARDYGISHAMVSNIVKRLRWA